ncbi:hypothetical protein CsSME_00047947 [Camellia sinensis var. sinensis]
MPCSDCWTDSRNGRPRIRTPLRETNRAKQFGRERRRTECDERRRQRESAVRRVEAARDEHRGRRTRGGDERSMPYKPTTTTLTKKPSEPCSATATGIVTSYSVTSQHIDA